MMVSRNPAAGQMTRPGQHRRHAAGASAGRVTGPSRLPVSAVALLAAAGVLVVALADTAGRMGHASSAWADRTYWLGQALIVVPVAVRMAGRRVRTAAETVTLVVVLAVAGYLVEVCYSPASFTYPDNLEHWRGTVNVLQTGKLSAPNYLLPISPHYPGLEEATSALASLTGLPADVCGLIVAGVAHLLFVCLLYLLFREIGGSDRAAGIAVLLYAGNSHFASFDSMFVYQTLALSFLGLALLAAWRLTAPVSSAAVPGGHAAAGGRRYGGWLTIGLMAIAATVVTHHVTSYVLVITLALISVASLAAGRWRTAQWPALLCGASAAAVIWWVAFAAPQTVGYLQPTATGLVKGLGGILSGASPSAPSISAGPFGNRLLSDVAILVMSAAIPLGWWYTWRRYRRQPWVVAMAIGSVSWYANIAVRLATADGSELAGRASTFVFVPAAFMVALAIVQLAGSAIRWKALTAASAALAGSLVFMFDGLANGWPPYWERLPGPHQVAGTERSVGPLEIASAQWALATLGPGNRFATDAGDYAVLGSYGYQNPVRDIAYLYTSPVYTGYDAGRVQAQSIGYILVDHRLSTSLPASGQYFPVDPGAGKYTRPLPVAGLDKFGHVQGADRIYDSGNIVIYGLEGAGYAP
jgi:hypothetical protein